MSTHRVHPDSFDEGKLDYDCERCQELTISDLSDKFLVPILGMTREEFDSYTDPSYDASGPAASLPPEVRKILYAFRYQMRNANAMQIQATVRGLRSEALLP
jgi:hypothetical protein